MTESDGHPDSAVPQQPQHLAHPLLTPPTPDQRQLLEVIARGRDRAEGHQWPIFQYVEWELYNAGRLNATEVMLTCPRVGSYGWFRVSSGTLMARPDDKIALTASGMTHLPGYIPRVRTFLKVLSCLVEAERSICPSPTVVQPTTMTSDDLINRLYERFEVAQGSGTVEFVLAELETEPATWRCGVQQLEDRRWAITLTPDLRLYEGVTTVEEYLDRLIDHISPVEPTPVFRSSGLALPEAIDYLNLAWRVHTEHPLFRVPRAEGAAKLAFECQSADEFDSLLSALCGILGRAELPGDGGSKLVDLEEYLESTLGEEAADRAIEAVKDLRAFFDLRAWRQHAGADERGHYAMRRLGLQLPATSWREAWATIQARGVNALNVIREELEGALWIA